MPDTRARSRTHAHPHGRLRAARAAVNAAAVGLDRLGYHAWAVELWQSAYRVEAIRQSFEAEQRAAVTSGDQLRLAP